MAQYVQKGSLIHRRVYNIKQVIENAKKQAKVDIYASSFILRMWKLL